MLPGKQRWLCGHERQRVDPTSADRSPVRRAHGPEPAEGLALAAAASARFLPVRSKTAFCILGSYEMGLVTAMLTLINPRRPEIEPMAVDALVDRAPKSPMPGCLSGLFVTVHRGMT
jgi:hypothetical protein